jgi:hypothetical protein
MPTSIFGRNARKRTSRPGPRLESGLFKFPSPTQAHARPVVEPGRVGLKWAGLERAMGLRPDSAHH